MTGEYTWDDFNHDIAVLPAWIAIGIGVAITAPFVVADCAWHKLCDIVTNVHKSDRK